MLLILLFAWGCSGEVNQLRVGYIEFPPYYYKNDQNMPLGSIIDDMKQEIKKKGIAVQFIHLPAVRLYTYLADGKIDLFATVKGSPRLKEKVYICDYPVAEISLNIFYKKGTAPIAKLEDLAGKSLIAQHGFSYSGYINQLTDPQRNIKVHYSHTAFDSFVKLLANRAPYLIDYMNSYKSIATKIDLSNIQNFVVSSAKVYIHISHKVKNPQKICSYFSGMSMR